MWVDAPMRGDGFVCTGLPQCAGAKKIFLGTGGGSCVMPDVRFSKDLLERTLCEGNWNSVERG